MYSKFFDNQQALPFHFHHRDEDAAKVGKLGKPEAYVMVRFAHNPHMLFADNDTALAYLQLKSIGLPESSAAGLSAMLCALVSDHLGVAADRTYIEFQDEHLAQGRGRRRRPALVARGYVLPGPPVVAGCVCTGCRNPV